MSEVPYLKGRGPADKAGSWPFESARRFHIPPLLILTFLVGVAYVPGLPSSSTVGRWSILAIGCCIFLWTSRVPTGPTRWMAAGLLAWLLAGFAWTVSGWDHAGGVTQMIILWAAFVVAANQQSMQPAWIGLGLAVTVSAGFAVAQILGFEPVWNISWDSSVGLFLTKNVAAEVSVLALIGAFAAKRWWLAPGALVHLALVHSRTAWLALVISFFTWLWIVAKHDREFVFLAAVLTALIGVMFFAVTGGLPRAFHFVDRWEIWKVAVVNFNPWGDGLGSFSIGAANYEFAHNQFLHYAFELGVGSILFWLIVAYAFGAPDGCAEKVGLVAIGVFAMLWFPFNAPTTAMVAALLAGHLTGQRRHAVAAESGRRASGIGGLRDEASSAADLRAFDTSRDDVSVRPQYPMVR